VSAYPSKHAMGIRPNQLICRPLRPSSVSGLTFYTDWINGLQTIDWTPHPVTSLDQHMGVNHRGADVLVTK
jgi:hypothetical protein